MSWIVPAVFLAFPLGVLAPVWLPSVVARTSSRDPLVQFVTASFRDEPDAWRRADRGLDTDLHHPTGVVVCFGWRDRVFLHAPARIEFGWRDTQRLLLACDRMNRRNKRLAEEKARVAALRQITGRGAA